MSEIYRYHHDADSSFITSLNPVDDLLDFISGLRSTSLVQDLLAEKHGFTNKQEIATACKAIRVHVDNAMSLLEQAQSSEVRISYLPTYYALSNLAKIVIIAGGYGAFLAGERYHGVSWKPCINKKVSSLLTDCIEIVGGGVFPLYYKTITGEMWSSSKKNNRRILKMGDIYKYVSGIGFEYAQLVGERNSLHPISVLLINDNGLFRLTIGVGNEPIDRRDLKILAGFKQIADTSYEKVSKTEDELLSGFRRFLIYDNYRAVPFTPVWHMTPHSRSRLMLPVELPIYLAFYHLSNVVRYDPERLYKFFDTKAVTILRSLARHGLYEYLMAFWCYMNQTSYRIYNQ